MTTQKVIPCEFVAGLCSNCGAQEQAGCEGWVAPTDQVDALIKERDALMAAAKLALDALEDAHRWGRYAYNVGKNLHGVPQAITALHQAGVQ